jgi:hypothetical protein
MEMSDDRLPRLGRSASRLGVRVFRERVNDLPVHEGYVQPNDGGLSVTPDDPLQMPPQFLPPPYGTGDDPVWTLSEDDLGPDLAFKADRRRTFHGFIEPSRRMRLEEFERALSELRSKWQLYYVEVPSDDS